MPESDVRYDLAAQVAAHVVNVLSGDHAGGPAERYAKVLFLVLDALYEAERRLAEARFDPSDN